MFPPLLTLLALLAPLALASASDTRCTLNPASYSFTVGNIKATVVSDGPAIFDVNLFSVPSFAVQRSYLRNFRGAFPLIWGQNVVVLDTPAGRVMVDAGSFNIPELPFYDQAGHLIFNLKAAGIDPSTIHAIIFTHAHPDHVSGVTDEKGRPFFPNAKIYIDRDDHQFWIDNPVPGPRSVADNATFSLVSGIYRRSIKPYQAAGALRLVEKNASPLPGIRFVPTPGHSVGHTVLEVTSKEERLVIIADTWVTKSDQLQNPEWGFFVETDRDQALESRVKTLERAASRRDLVLSYHESFPGLGHIREMGPFFDWAPATPQLLGVGVRREC